jgi:hypothetical protein
MGMIIMNRKASMCVIANMTLDVKTIYSITPTSLAMNKYILNQVDRILEAKRRRTNSDFPSSTLKLTFFC